MSNSFITSYEEIRQLKPKTLRGSMRDIALSGLSMMANKAALSKPRIQFLYIHHIFRDEEQALRHLLSRLKETHQFITYTEAVDKVLAGAIDKPYVTFSSDDGFKNNVKAAEIMNEFGASCCFFINPGIIGENDIEKVKKYCNERLQFYPVDFMNWEDVTKLQKDGHEIGNHTMFHMNVAKASEQEIVEDMARSLQILKKECGVIKHFAFPFGRFFHFSKIGRKAVFDSGHISCATAERGCHVNPPVPMLNTDLCIRRDHTVLGWNMNHILYFLINSAKTARPENNLFPDSLK